MPPNKKARKTRTKLKSSFELPGSNWSDRKNWDTQDGILNTRPSTLTFRTSKSRSTAKATPARSSPSWRTGCRHSLISSSPIACGVDGNQIRVGRVKAGLAAILASPALIVGGEHHLDFGLKIKAIANRRSSESASDLPR